MSGQTSTGCLPFSTTLLSKDMTLKWKVSRIELAILGSLTARLFIDICVLYADLRKSQQVKIHIVSVGKLRKDLFDIMIFLRTIQIQTLSSSIVLQSRC